MVKVITIAVAHQFEVYNVGSSLIFKSGFGLCIFFLVLCFSYRHGVKPVILNIPSLLPRNFVKFL